MEELNNWMLENIGAWTRDYFALFVLIAVGLAVIWLFTIIISVAVSAGKTKKIRKLEHAKSEEPEGEQEGSVQPDTEALRAEIEAEVRAEYEQKYADTAPADESELNERCFAMSRQIDDLNAEIREKDNTINSLAAELESARAAVAAASSAPRESEYAEAIDQWEAATKDLEAQVNKLTIANNELTQKNSVLEAEHSRLYDEIAKRSQAQENQSDRLLNENIELGQQNARLRAENERLSAELSQLKRGGRAAATEPPAEAEGPAKATKRTAPKKEQKPVAPPPPVEDDDDDEDEVYDDFGDDSSLVKVTVKFDRVKNTWVILRSDTDRAYRRLGTKQEAVIIGKDLAHRLHAQLVVHKKDGKFQKV